jgi:hypothetical protein
MRFALLVVAFVVGCGATGSGVRFGEPPPLATPAPTGPSRASSPDVGVIGVISDAMSELALDDAQQRDVVALLDETKKNHRPALDARAMLAIDMARSVETALVDERQLMADAATLGDARAAATPDDARTLEKLHAMLKPAQRIQFATGLRSKAESLRLDDFASRLGLWRSDIGITTDQAARIEPKLRAEHDDSAQNERAAWQKRLRDTAAAFTGASFSGQPFVDPDARTTSVARIRRLVTFLKIVVPELTVEQQERAAKYIRAEAGVSVGLRDR